MKVIQILICSLLALVMLNACVKKKPVGSFQSVECRTICNNGTCTQQCVGAAGDYYKK